MSLGINLTHRIAYEHTLKGRWQVRRLAFRPRLKVPLRTQASLKFVDFKELQTLRGIDITVEDVSDELVGSSSDNVGRCVRKAASSDEMLVTPPAVPPKEQYGPG